MAADLSRGGSAARTPERELGPVNWELVSAHAELLRKIAWNVWRRLPATTANVCIEDLLDAGRDGLVQAALRFDPSRGWKFATLAQYRVQGAILDWLRKTSRDRIALPLEVELDGEEKPGHWQWDPRPGPDVQADLARVWGRLKSFPERTQRIFELYYGEADLSDAKISRQFGVTPSCITQIRTRALAKLRKQAA